MNRLAVLIFAVAGLVGCGQGARSYAWFKAHPKAASEAVAACAGSSSRECANAERAVADAAYEKRRDVYRKAF